MKKIFIVDRYPLTRDGLAMTLDAEPDLIICGQAGSGEETLSLFERANPDLLITDVELLELNGLVLTETLRKRKPDLHILITSTHNEAICAERALRAGARGYVLKDETTDVVVHAVRRLLQGAYYISERVCNKLLTAITQAARPLIPSPASVLSKRELEFFEFIGLGLEPHEIAERMHLSIKTVSTYRNRIKHKLNLAGNSDLIRLAMKLSDEERICYCWRGLETVW